MFPTCAICAQPLLPSGEPVLDDGACYHRACMERRAFGSEPQARVDAGAAADVPFGRSLAPPSRELIVRARSTLDGSPAHGDLEGGPGS